MTREEFCSHIEIRVATGTPNPLLSVKPETVMKVLAEGIMILQEENDFLRKEILELSQRKLS